MFHILNERTLKKKPLRLSNHAHGSLQADGAEARTLHLSYHDGDHYNSIRSGDDTGDGPAQPIKANWQVRVALTTLNSPLLQA